jgi:hypothetical protein
MYQKRLQSVLRFTLERRHPACIMARGLPARGIYPALRLGLSPFPTIESRGGHEVYCRLGAAMRMHYRIHDRNSMMSIKAINRARNALRLYRFGLRCYIILDCFFYESHGYRLRCGLEVAPRSSSKPRANRRSIAAKTACWPAGVLRPTSSKNACKSIDFCPSSSKIRRTRRSVSFTIVFNGENRGRVRHPLRLCQKPMILCEY